MGRKIPGKKHRGVKDPFEQSAKRKAGLQKKINAPPPNPDDQDIPRSVERIMKLKQAVKDGLFEKKRKKRRRNAEAEKSLLPGLTRLERPTPIFRRLPGESESHFVRRMEAECQEVIAETKFEQEFDVSVEKDPSTGEVTGVSKRQKIELDRIMEKYVKGDRSGEKRKLGKEGEGHGIHKCGQLSKKERWKLRKKEKLQKLKQKEVDEFEHFRDDVKFGEVVHAPPVLKAPRTEEASTASTLRPGRRSLLLTAILEQDRAKLQQEQRRQRAVDAYRLLKTHARLR